LRPILTPINPLPVIFHRVQKGEFSPFSKMFTPRRVPHSEKFGSQKIALKKILPQRKFGECE